MNRVMNSLIHIMLMFFIFIVYTLLHEGGHALAALLYAAEVTEFNINFITGRPHVSYSGGDLSLGQRAFISMAGPLFPLLIWIVVYFLGKIRDHIILKKAIVLSGIGLVFTLVPNVIIPILHEMGQYVVNEDIVKVVIYSGLNSYLISGLCLIIILVLGTLLIMTLTPISTIKEQVDLNLTNRIHVALGGILSAGIFVLLMVSSLNLIRGSLESNQIKPPEDATQIVHVDFATDELNDRIIYEFEVTEPKLYEFFTIGDTEDEVVINMESSVHIRGLRADQIPVYKNKGYKQGMMSWYLDRGTYQIVLEESVDAGTIDLYQKTRSFAGLEGFTDEDIFNENIPDVPSEYALVYEGTIQNGDNIKLYNFTIDEGQSVFFTIFLTTRTGEAIVRVVGEDVDDQLISKDQIMTDARGTYLRPGDYDLELDASDCDGKIFIYMKK